MRADKALAAGLIAIALGACASNGEESTIGSTTRGMSDAAATPLRDVGLIRPSIPDVIESLRYPYVTTTLPAGCPAVAFEIDQLDGVLGPESYQPGEETSLVVRGANAASDAAVDAVRGAAEFIPFRGLVRRASGATRAEDKAARAIELAQTRRAFLRGYGAALGCSGVVPAPPPAEPPPTQNGVGAPP